jgi:hypothetical protein
VAGLCAVDDVEDSVEVLVLIPAEPGSVAMPCAVDELKAELEVLL